MIIGAAAPRLNWQRLCSLCDLDDVRYTLRMPAKSSAMMKKGYTGVSRETLMKRDMSRKRASAKKRAEKSAVESELMSTAVRTASGAGMGWLFASYPDLASLSIPGSAGKGVDTRLLVAAVTKGLCLTGQIKGDTAKRVSEVGDAAAVLFGHDLAVSYVTKG